MNKAVFGSRRTPSILILGHRCSGKTMTLARIIALDAMNGPCHDPHRALVIATNRPQANRLFELVYSMIDVAKITRRVQVPYPQITLSNGSTIKFVSHHSLESGGRGTRPTHLYLDDSEFLPEGLVPLLGTLIYVDEPRIFETQTVTMKE